ncbi:MAG: serine/threonine protein kinase [Deltaproteobacteria bacterium]|nr:serine/threonine protein kinase [Deltaproteobacteria bacterium]
MSLSPDDDEEDSHPSLALGTADAHREERTKIESPNARSKTPVPVQPKGSKPPPLPKGGHEEPERVGTQLGSYRVSELLGKGGMGYVFRAEHVKLGREVALKLLRSDYARRRDAVARFFQEARTVNRVRHRNIVDVTDFVELDDGTTFIIMEFLRGQNLGKWARTGIDLPRALAVLVQICDGLGAAHQVGVVHRDLKPDNIIVVPTNDGAELVKLLDFGVAKLLNRDDEDIGFQTAAGSVIGTPAYMSPEQAGGMSIDARSDTYALGAIMYELFCGQPMFRGRSFGEYVRKHLTEMPVPPRATEQGRGIDPGLEMVILKCLEKDPNQRFSSIMELRDALLGMLGGMETHPPGFVSINMSGMRPLPQMSGIAPSAAAVAPTMVPQLLPQMLPTLALQQQQQPMMIPSQPMMQAHPTPASQSHPSGANAFSYTGSNVGYSQMMLPTPPPQQVTPWWVWFVGGALAVGLGVAAAVWYANRSSDNKVTETAAKTGGSTLQATPIEPTAQQFVELRFDSLPSGGVYAEGQSAELCTTPCATKLDTKDGGSTERRAFVVKSPGYKDGRIDVDLTAAPREFRVTLDREATVTEVKPVETTPVVKDKSEPERVGGKTGKITKITKTIKKDAKPEEKEVKPLPTFQGDEKPATVDGKKRDPGKKTEKIDATETIDPFKK